MSYWVWDHSLDLGIEILDAQHRQIVDFINELNEAYLSQDNFLVSKALMGLLDYTITHFAFEEKLMELANYPLITEHKNLHVDFTQHIHEYKKQHDSGLDITKNLLSELRAWLVQHIQNEDKAYIPHVKKRLNGGGGYGVFN